MIGLLLPAVQAAREAARRMQCTNNFKQCMLGMHNYVDAHGKFPVASFTGSGRAHETTWARCLLPFIEQTTLYDGIPTKAGNAGWGANDSYFCKKRVTTYCCPSDTWQMYKDNANGWCQHNYVVCVGKTGTSQWSTSGDATVINGWREWVTYGDRVVQYKEAIFRCGSYQGQGYRCQPMAAITDGTSNTMAMSEIIQVSKSQDINGKATADERGNLWYPWGCAYSAFFTPNTQEMDYLGCIPTRAANAIFAPATDKTLDAAIIISARSRHSGGVNVAMADGSVRFVSDTINLDVWAAASTAKGGETETF
ncbi:MAG: DUF1559 domain-containing protein [Thermoguttaceae bacterium]|nr:DUF1559 domain-containing protein [Thermoguttaceae bacterium]